jgi:hypothetical protein
MTTERRTGRGWNIWHWLERKNFVSIHAFMLYATMWMTWRITEQAWAYAFASHTSSGVEAAAVIGAVTVPFAALQGFVFKIYSDSRK